MYLCTGQHVNDDDEKAVAALWAKNFCRHELLSKIITILTGLTSFPSFWIEAFFPVSKNSPYMVRHDDVLGVSSALSDSSCLRFYSEEVSS